MGLFYCCCCTLLVLINIIYMIIGIVLLALGIILTAGKDFVLEKLGPFLKSFFDSLSTNSSINVNGGQMFTYLLNSLSSIAIALIIVGTIFFIISIIGMCSVCCRAKILLIVYIAILSAIVLAQIITIIIFAADPTKARSMVEGLIKDMIVKYEGFFSSNPESFIINVMNIGLSCCGAINYQDFNVSVKFNRTYTGTFTYGGKTESYNTQLDYPISCCQFKDFQFVNAKGCIEQKVSNNKDIGCVKNLFDNIQIYMTITLQVIGGIIGYQLLILLAAAVCLVSLIKEAGVKPV